MRMKSKSPDEAVNEARKKPKNICLNKNSSRMQKKHTRVWLRGGTYVKLVQR